jgi:pimeloyl-ACP methyl ester carboxylesterase
VASPPPPGTRRAPQPYTAVVLHGILGSRRNLASFVRRMAALHPSWQFLLVDLRCHGGSATGAVPGPHTLAAAADDVLRLLAALKLYPHALMGHSFGGKVAMAMVHQFGSRSPGSVAAPLARPVLPRPVQVWVLDTVPGDVFADGGDHPRDVIAFVQSLAMPLQSRKQLVDALTGRGFTQAGAQWMTTNLVQRPDGALDWAFNIEGIADMYRSYEATDLWPLVESPPQGALIDFVRAERSAFRWSGPDEQRIAAAGARVHLLRDASHWVHIDNPEGLAEILGPSLARLQG